MEGLYFMTGVESDIRQIMGISEWLSSTTLGMLDYCERIKSLILRGPTADRVVA